LQLCEGRAIELLHLTNLIKMNKETKDEGMQCPPAFAKLLVSRRFSSFEEQHRCEAELAKLIAEQRGFTTVKKKLIVDCVVGDLIEILSSCLAKNDG
jgi:hypothetical protein